MLTEPPLPMKPLESVSAMQESATCPALMMRAARCTSSPTYPLVERSGSPVCKPMRTRTTTPSGQEWLAVRLSCWAIARTEGDRAEHHWCEEPLFSCFGYSGLLSHLRALTQMRRLSDKLKQVLFVQSRTTRKQAPESEPLQV
jgi:hypothetical protein